MRPRPSFLLLLAALCASHLAPSAGRSLDDIVFGRIRRDIAANPDRRFAIMAETAQADPCDLRGANFSRFERGTTFAGGCNAGEQCIAEEAGWNVTKGYCIPCMMGQYCPRGSVNAAAAAQGNLCPRGSYCPNSTLMHACPAGGVCMDGAFFVTQCDESGVLCEEGMKLDLIPNVTFCPAGYYCPSPAEKVQCNASHYCKEGQVQPWPCHAWMSCPAGTKAPGTNWAAIVFALVVFLALMAAHVLLARRQRRKMALTQRRLVHKQYTVDLYNKLFGRVLGHDVKLLNFKGLTRNPLPIGIDFDGLGLVIPNAASSGSSAISCGCTGGASGGGGDGGGAKTAPTAPSSSSSSSSSAARRGRRVLRKVTGRLARASVTAIMGPSGSGKSTFLNVLSGRARAYGKVEGTVRVNGAEVKSFAASPDTSFRRAVGFVPQDDVCHEDLTVRENLKFSAYLRLPRGRSKAEVKAIVDDVINVLGLADCQNAVVGSVAKRGISGGQRKRLNIGLELVADPSVLFLDEPTSGLDSTTSESVIKALRTFATRLHVTVALVIHQPRYSIFELFDNVLLLAKGGRQVYMGPAASCVAYFESLGHVLPARENPADFLLDVISQGQVLPGSIKPVKTPAELAEAWREHVRRMARNDTKNPLAASLRLQSMADETEAEAMMKLQQAAEEAKKKEKKKKAPASGAGGDGAGGNTSGVELTMISKPGNSGSKRASTTLETAAVDDKDGGGEGKEEAKDGGAVTGAAAAAKAKAPAPHSAQPHDATDDDLRRIFREIDIDGSGLIAADELLLYLRSAIDTNATSAEAVEIIHSFFGTARTTASGVVIDVAGSDGDGLRTPTGRENSIAQFSENTRSSEAGGEISEDDFVRSLRAVEAAAREAEGGSEDDAAAASAGPGARPGGKGRLRNRFSMVDVVSRGDGGGGQQPTNDELQQQQQQQQQQQATSSTPGARPPSFCFQVLKQLHRGGIQLTRRPGEHLFGLLLVYFGALANGLLWGTGWDHKNYVSMTSMSLIVTSLLAVVSSLNIFSDKVVYWRETRSGVSPLAYYVATNILGLVYVVLEPLCFLSIYYTLIWPMTRAPRFFFVYFGISWACR